MSTDLVLTSPEPRAITLQEMTQEAFRAAISQGAAMEVVNTILAQQRWAIEHGEAENFNAALKRIQKQLKAVPKRGWNPDTKSPYALAADVDAAINHLLDAENMTLSFAPAVSDKPDEVLIVGTLSLGAFSKTYPLPMPADGKGAKGGGVMSRTHATGSAITYGKRYLKDMIFNLSFEDPRARKLDDDGNGAGNQGGKDPIEESVVMDFIASIEGSATKEELKDRFFAAANAAKDAGDSRAAEAFTKAKNKVWKERGFRA